MQPEKYRLLEAGEVTLPGVDDFDAFLETKSALDHLKISEEEQDNMFRLIAAILHLGNISFIPDDQGIAEIENEEILEDHVSVLLGVNCMSNTSYLTNFQIVSFVRPC